MYPVDGIYGLTSFRAWRESASRTPGAKESTLPKSSWEETRDGDFWDVGSWDELRYAVSYLTLMNKRNVLYFRGQGSHYAHCSPVLFRDRWTLNERTYFLNRGNRGKYYSAVRRLQPHVFKVAMHVGTPRAYILQHFPAAAAAILQHYELWPTHFIDVTRSLPIAISFAEGAGNRQSAYLYAFAMPDLRGSVTSDIDQQLSLARLEAICPPAAKRPHHQDAYLVARFPEPQGECVPGEEAWDDWQAKTDLTRRLAAKFRLNLTDGRLFGCPRIASEYLIPSLQQDEFGRHLLGELLPVIERILSQDCA